MDLSNATTPARWFHAHYKTSCLPVGSVDIFASFLIYFTTIYIHYTKMRPAVISLTIAAIGVSVVFLPADIPILSDFEWWTTPQLRSSVVYTCTSFSGADSLCRVVLHYRVSPAVANEDYRCTLLGAGAAAAVVAMRI
ncbi:hypothetical protein QBC47DRAFT_388810 [Echria macrotheca]|uniref:Uncharacterized protein n=1 Tax=Echria macrotheca TaxID=438768 RepID=A0AAJ0B6G3_9PEZI|nr:hypothetical protein QBC47DRAFT_388810 [Echria macrotheca]